MAAIILFPMTAHPKVYDVELGTIFGIHTHTHVVRFQIIVEYAFIMNDLNVFYHLIS